MRTVEFLRFLSERVGFKPTNLATQGRRLSRGREMVLVNIQHDYAESERKPDYDVARHRARASCHRVASA